jgi:hypothetical protein
VGFTCGKGLRFFTRFLHTAAELSGLYGVLAAGGCLFRANACQPSGVIDTVKIAVFTVNDELG